MYCAFQLIHHPATVKPDLKCNPSLFVSKTIELKFPELSIPVIFFKPLPTWLLSHDNKIGDCTFYAQFN